MNEKKFKVKRYEKLDEILSGMFNLSPKDLKGSKVGGLLDDGTEIEISYEEELESIKEGGYYGYIDEDKIIHFWLNDKKKVSFEELIFFFAHEIGHRTGNQPSSEDYSKNRLTAIKEEKRADEYGEVAKLAFQFASLTNNIGEDK